MMFIRTIHSVLFMVTLCGTGTSQILLQTGFESWTDGVPDGLIGSKTTLSADSITPVAEPIHAGFHAMRIGLGTSNGSLSTLPLAVEAYRLYEIRYWVQGSGRIAPRIYDGRPQLDGISVPGSVVHVETDTWQHVLHTVLATTTTNDAEFILELTGEVEGDHLILDELTINTSIIDIPLAAPIAQIQTTTHWTGSSPLNFAFVRTVGAITAITPNGLFIQDGSGPWSGIEVLYPPPPGLELGDSVLVLGTVDELGGLVETWPRTRTRIIAVQHLEVYHTGGPVPASTEVALDQLHEEQWESVLVRVPDLICQNAPDPFTFDWPAGNGTDQIQIDDLIHYHFPTIGAVYTITGIALYAGGMVLLPRSEADITVVVGLAEHTHHTAHVWPNPATDVLHIQASSAVNARYIVMDATGRQVLQGLVTNGLSTIDVSMLTAGAYVLRMADMGTTRFVVR